MRKKVDQFDKSSPEKVYQRAQIFSHTFSKTVEMPTSPARDKSLKHMAKYNKESIRFTIDSSKYQNNLYKKLERGDIQKRRSFEKKIVQKNKIVSSNVMELRKKEEKQIEKTNKHLKDVYKKHTQLEKQKKRVKDENAVKLRKQLLTFYEKEQERRKSMDHQQVKVSTCYQNAMDRLERIHKRNQQYSLRSQMSHEKKMARNNSRDEIIRSRSRLKSAQNSKKSLIYENSSEMLNQKENHFIQLYGRDLDISEKAFQHKEKEEKKTKERINKCFKEKVEKWKNRKRRVEELKSEIPQRCLDILDKTSRASYRQTISSFKDSAKEWQFKVQTNKSVIYENDERGKDKIMENHLDMRFKNVQNSRIHEKMSSMRNQAKKLASQFN